MILMLSVSALKKEEEICSISWLMPKILLKQAQVSHIFFHPTTIIIKLVKSPYEAYYEIDVFMMISGYV